MTPLCWRSCQASEQVRCTSPCFCQKTSYPVETKPGQSWTSKLATPVLELEKLTLQDDELGVPCWIHSGSWISIIWCSLPLCYWFAHCSATWTDSCIKLGFLGTWTRKLAYYKKLIEKWRKPQKPKHILLKIESIETGIFQCHVRFPGVVHSELVEL